MDLKTGLLIVGALGVVYGLTLAFVLTKPSQHQARGRFTKIGAFVLLGAFLVLGGIPLLRGDVL